ncbi:MAG: methylthioribulose 1-phosphate dehydratase [Bradymonadaceae bacterium]
MFDITRYATVAQAIVDAGRFLYERGWSPATSSNYSARIDGEHIAITVSGKHKGELEVRDVMVVDRDGEPVHCSTRPSAETRLHTSIYDLYADVGAVLHTHSETTAVLSRHLSDQDELEMTGYELQKALPGYESHASTLRLPVFENTQDISALAERTRAYFAEHPDTPGYLIRGHGLYTWGATMEDCLRHVEALESLLSCELKRLRMSP